MVFEALIEAYTREGDNLDYIDIYSKMLGADGQPRAELFLPDRLHLNADGYAVWKAAIGEHLKPNVSASAPQAKVVAGS